METNIFWGCPLRIARDFFSSFVLSFGCAEILILKVTVIEQKVYLNFFLLTSAKLSK